MAEPSQVRRRFRQFSLRGLLVVLGLVAIAFGIWSNASAQRELHLFDKGLRVSLTRRNSLGSFERVHGAVEGGYRNLSWSVNEKMEETRPSYWALWRSDTVQSLFVQSVEPKMAANALDPLLDIPTIERLELTVDEMDPRAIQSLRDLHQLESFQWEGNFDEACLLTLPRMPSVKRLELKPKDGNRLGAGLQALERLPKLSQLAIHPDNLSGTVALSQAKLSPTPLALEIGIEWGLGVRPSTFDLSDMSSWSSVYYLKLSQVRPIGSIDFASMPNLQTIHLESVSLTAADIEQLAQLPNLERVTLAYTGLSDSQVAQLLSNPNLRGIVVNERDVTSVAFEGLPNCPRLESLKVPERAVDEELFEKLRQAPSLKQCEVFPGTNNLRRDRDISTLQRQIDEMLQKQGS